MATLVDLYNISLGILGISHTVSDPEARDHQTSTLRKFWPQARDYTLREFPWHCARKVRVLSLRDQVYPGFAYSYNYPNDCLFALAVMPVEGLRARNLWVDCWNDHINHRQPRYVFDRALNDGSDGQIIATDLPSAYLLQITRVTNVTVFDPGLVMTAAAQLAKLSAATFKVKAEFVKIAVDTYEIERAKATANDFNEGYPDAEPMTPSLAARE